MTDERIAAVFNAVQRAVFEIVGDGCVISDPSDTLESLEIDSLTLIEASMFIEEDLDIELELQDFEGVVTVGDVVQIIAKKVGN